MAEVSASRRHVTRHLHIDMGSVNEGRTLGALERAIAEAHAAHPDVPADATVYITDSWAGSDLRNVLAITWQREEVSSATEEPA